MPTTRAEARNEVLSLLTEALVGAGVDRRRILYEGKKGADPAIREGEAPWARIEFNESSGEQRSLTGGIGRARFEVGCVVLVQVFTRWGDGLIEDDRISVAVKRSMQGVATPGGGRFRDVVARPSGEDGPWWLTIVSGSFEYDEWVSV